MPHIFTPFQTCQQNNSPSPLDDRCDIYALACMTCNKAYVGQTSRSLKQSYKEQTSYIKSNNPQSAYALHILNNQHEYGPIEKTTLFKPLKNSSLLTPYERFFIQSFHKAGRLISEQNPRRTYPTAPDGYQPLPFSYMTRLVEQKLSHSAHSLRPSSTQPQPTQPGMYSVYY